jgi:hypothetical protein
MRPKIGSPSLLYADSAIPAQLFISVLSTISTEIFKSMLQPPPPLHFEVLLFLS